MDQVNAVVDPDAESDANDRIYTKKGGFLGDAWSQGTAAMATMAYKENRTVFWDRDKQQVI